MSKAESFVAVPHYVPPEPLLQALATHPELWATTMRETFQGTPHGQAQSIILRWQRLPAGADPVQASFEQTGDFEDLPASDALMPVLGETVWRVIEHLGPLGELGRIMLTRLPPGAEIGRHIDEGAYAEMYDRFHLCLQGDSSNTFECGPESLHPYPGQVFWFNHKCAHRVVNSGVIDRIHLIVDVMAPRYTSARGTYYQEERLSEASRLEIEELLQAHYREVAHYQDIALDPDWALYANLQEKGELRIYTARDAGRLAAYAVFFVRTNPHYRTSLQAHQDVYFVRPEHRSSMIPVRLIKLAEERLRAQGVQVIYHHAKRTNQFGALLARLGYTLIDEIYGKRLDREEGKGS